MWESDVLAVLPLRAHIKELRCLMETQEQLVTCPFCGLEQPPETTLWNPQENLFEAICQECGKKFSGPLSSVATEFTLQKNSATLTL
jgi:transcription elongation factor Elf1